MLDNRIYLRVTSSEKRIFKEVTKRKLQDGRTIMRANIRDYIRSYFVEEIGSIDIPAETEFFDRDWVKKKGISSDMDLEIVFNLVSLEYNQDENQISPDRWDYVFENYPELLEDILRA